MADIHPSAIVDPRAQLAEGVSIGAYSAIGPNVIIDSGTTIGHHVVITGHTHLGRYNKIYPFSSLGEAPQDKKYAGEPTRLEVGHYNVIREFCTFNVGTVQDQGVTTIGDHNWIMAYVHIAHDCTVGNHIVFANSSQLAGHVEIENYAVLGGFTGVHQHCRIGAHAITGAGSIVLQDIPPYVMAAGNPIVPRGINSEGLRRRSFSAASIASIKRAYKILFRSGLSLEEAKQQLIQLVRECAEVQLLIDFLNKPGRGLAR